VAGTTIKAFLKGCSDGESKRSRGHQPGSPGHGRRDYSHLPVQEDVFELDETVCPHCGCPYHEDTFPGTEDSELIEVDVRAYRRKVRRKKYRKGRLCQQDYHFFATMSYLGLEGQRIDYSQLV
jgi:hypothetical protein